MRTTKTTAMALAAACVFPGYARAQGAPTQGPALVGLWKLVSYEVEIRSSGKKDPVMGAHPTGYAYFTPEGRVFFLLTGEGRTPAKDDAHRAHLLETLVSYTGKVTFKDDQWTAKLDTAWDPKWVGTEQTRTFKRMGDRLEVLTPWRVMPNWAAQGETRSIVTFEQAKD